MRTTLDRPDPLFEKVKTQAVEQGVKLKDLLAAYIEAGLRDSSIVATPIGKRQPLPIGIPRSPGEPLHPAMTNAELHSLMDGEDLEHYRRVTHPEKLAE